MTCCGRRDSPVAPSSLPPPRRRSKNQGITKAETGSNNVCFTDTIENLAKFVADTGDKLFPTEALSLQRVK